MQTLVSAAGLGATPRRAACFIEQPTGIRRVATRREPVCVRVCVQPDISRRYYVNLIMLLLYHACLHFQNINKSVMKRFTTVNR